MDCQFNGQKENRATPMHVTGDLVLLHITTAYIALRFILFV
jgi:hypothetical protein